jgi:hypothetical protein
VDVVLTEGVVIDAPLTDVTANPVDDARRGRISRYRQATGDGED